MLEKFLEIFLNSDLEIKSEKKLTTYINYCLNNNKKERIIENKNSITSYHHILPRALFPQYSDLKENSWNGSHLLFYDHYMAHWLFVEAITDHGQLYAFTRMHTADVSNGRIKEENLIPEEQFKEKMLERNKMISENNKKRAREGVLFNNYNYDKEQAVIKRKETLRNNPEIILKANAKHSETINQQEWKDKVGALSALKQSKTKRSQEWKEKHESERVKKFKESFKKSFNKQEFDERVLKRSKFKNFEIFNSNDELCYKYDGLLTEFCRNNGLPIQALIKSNKENPLYTTKAGLRNAKKYGFEKYKGYYLVLV